MDRNEASEALAAVAGAKKSLAAASAAPLWRHAAFALVIPLIMSSVLIDEQLRILPLLLGMLGIVLLVQWDRRQTGLFVNGYRRGRTLPLSIGLLLAIVGLTFAALRLGAAGEHGLALLTLPAAFIVAFGASLWWERIFLGEMGAGK